MSTTTQTLFDITHPKILDIVRETVGIQQYRRVQQSCSLDLTNHNINSFPGILQVLAEYNKRNPDSNVYQKVLCAFLSYLSTRSRDNVIIDASTSKASNTKSSDRIDGCIPSITASLARVSTGGETPNTTTTANLEVKKPKNSAPVSIKKVVNIINNYYYGDGKKKVQSVEDAVSGSESDSAQTITSTSSSKCRRVRPRNVLTANIQPSSRILKRNLYPRVCHSDSCLACSSAFLQFAKECRDSKCTAEHCENRHIPTLNNADRRNLRRIHRAMEKSKEPVLPVQSGHDKVGQYLTGLPSIPEISDVASECESISSKRSWYEQCRAAEPKGSDFDDDDMRSTKKQKSNVA